MDLVVPTPMSFTALIDRLAVREIASCPLLWMKWVKMSALRGSVATVMEGVNLTRKCSATFLIPCLAGDFLTVAFMPSESANSLTPSASLRDFEVNSAPPWR